MKWILLSTMAWRNLKRHWRHSLSTLVAIASGFTAMALFDGFMEGVKQQSLDSFAVRFMLGHIIIEKPDTQYHLTEGDWEYTLNQEEQVFLEDFFQHEPNFLRRCRFLGVLGLVNNGSTQSVFYGSGYDIKEGTEMRGDMWSWNTLAGKPLHLSPEYSLLLGKSLSQKMGCEFTAPESPHHKWGGYTHEERPFHCLNNQIQISATTASGQINALDLNVSGIMDVPIRELDNKYISFSLETAQRLLNTNHILRTAVQLKDPSRQHDFISRLQKEAQSHHFKFDVIPVLQHQVAKLTRDGLVLISLFRRLFMGIVLLISVLSIGNTMAKAVLDRTQEIGTLRSLGFLCREIRSLFAWEGSLLALTSCCLGFLLTLILSAAINLCHISYSAGVLSTPMPLTILWVPLSWLELTGLLTFLAFLITLWTTGKTTRKVIADSLRQNT